MATTVSGKILRPAGQLDEYVNAEGALMSREHETRGFRLAKSDQVTIVAVAIAIVVLTGFLVGLLF